MARTKYDPLEAAKIGSDSKPSSPTPSFSKADDLDVSDVEIESAPQPRPAVSASPKYRVLVAGRVSLDGQICTMPKDSVLDSAGYGGEAGIEKLRSQGLKLELVS